MWVFLHFFFFFSEKQKQRNPQHQILERAEKHLYPWRYWEKKNRPIYICGTRKLSDNCKKNRLYKQKQHASCWGFNAGSILLPDLISTDLKTSFYSGRTALQLLPWIAYCMNLGTFLSFLNSHYYYFFICMTGIMKLTS